MTPVCFIDARQVPINGALNHPNKRVLGWTLMQGHPTFGQVMQYDGETRFVINWFYVIRPVPELTPGIEVPNPMMEVWLVDDVEMRRRQAAAATGHAPLIGADHHALDALNSRVAVRR